MDNHRVFVNGPGHHSCNIALLQIYSTVQKFLAFLC